MKIVNRLLIALILLIFSSSCFIAVYRTPSPIAQKAYSAPCERVISNLTTIVNSKDLKKEEENFFSLKVEELEFKILCGDHYSVINVYGEDRQKAESILNEVDNLMKSI